MEVSVPSFVWPLVLGANVLLVASLAVAARRHVRPRDRGLGVGAVLTLWFAAVVTLSARGAFVAGASGPPAIALGVFPPLVLGGLALALSRSVRTQALAIPPPWLVGIQTLRAVGIVFVVLLGDGVLPRQFALPAGWGDFVVGAAAPLVALALAREKPWARPLALAWNVLGVLDLVVALGMGALSAPSAIRVFLGDPSTAAMARLPLSTVPAFAVPIFLLLHAISVLGLVRWQGSRGSLAPRRPLESGA